MLDHPQLLQKLCFFDKAIYHRCMSGTQWTSRSNATFGTPISLLVMVSPICITKAMYSSLSVTVGSSSNLHYDGLLRPSFQSICLDFGCVGLSYTTFSYSWSNQVGRCFKSTWALFRNACSTVNNILVLGMAQSHVDGIYTVDVRNTGVGTTQ